MGRHLINTDFLKGLPIFTVAPGAMAVWVFTPDFNAGRFYLNNCASANSRNNLVLGLDQNNNTGKIAAVSHNDSGGVEALSSIVVPESAWFLATADFINANTQRAGINGSNFGPNVTGGFGNPVGINEFLIGRRSDGAFAGVAQLAHAMGFAAPLSLTEWAALGAGMNPAHIRNILGYWSMKFTGIGGTEPDLIGSNILTVTGTTASDTNPVICTRRIASVGGLGLQIGTPFSLNLAPIFADPTISTDYTISAQQLGAAAQVTTCDAAGGPTRVIPVNSTAAFTGPGDYLQLGDSGSPTCVKYVDSVNGNLLVADDQTFAINAPVFRRAPAALTISGLSASAKLYGGTPGGTARSLPLSFFRATSIANTALVEDSDLITISITGASLGLSRPGKRRRGGYIAPVYLKRRRSI